MGYVKASNIAICDFCAIEQQHRISQRGKWASDGEQSVRWIIALATAPELGSLPPICVHVMNDAWHLAAPLKFDIDQQRLSRACVKGP
jgi:hypothetical protein